MSQVTVFSYVERRRVWTDEQEVALIAAASAPGSSVTQVARDADLRPSQTYRWRHDLERHVASGVSVEPGYAPLLIETGADHARRLEGGIIVEVGRAAVRSGRLADPGGGSGAVASAMIPVPNGVRNWIAVGRTDMPAGKQGGRPRSAVL